jgi:hypothetical protein
MIVKGSGGEYYLAVMSARRSGNVALLEDMIGHRATWYVTKGEQADYFANGATAVLETGQICESRNAALRDARRHGLPCVQLSDDLRKLQIMDVDGDAQHTTFTFAADLMIDRLQRTPFQLAGVAPTANTYFFSTRRRVQTAHFVVGDFIVIGRNSSLLFDENITFKEDYDFTVQNIHSYGGVVRCNDILATFLHNTNEGGAVRHRTAEAEQRGIAYLNAKWPDAFLPNKKRENEILMRRVTSAIELPTGVFD